MTREHWTTDAQPRRNILSELERDAKKMAGDPREIFVTHGPDPYQSDEAARLTRKALLILEQYRLHALVWTQCGMRSALDFDILARNRWKYGSCESLREEWEPGAAPIAERIQALREAHAAGIATWVKIAPAAYPAELIEVVESLRSDVDAWKIGLRLPGEPPQKTMVAGRPGFVDADTALAYLRRMVEKGLSDKLPRTDGLKIWSPNEKDAGKSGEAEKAEE
jgi:hypothetical protein